ncbi:MAG: zinc-binding dehydrogenase, partial [Limisphaerales bacterium]
MVLPARVNKSCQQLGSRPPICPANRCKYLITSYLRTKSPKPCYVAKHTNSEGFDVVFDTLGGATLDNSFLAVKTYTGHVVSCLGWGVHALAPLSFRGATYSGVFSLLPMLTGRARIHHGDILRQATELAEAGKLRPLLSKEQFTFATAQQAYTAVETGGTVGKVVVELDDGPVL